MSINSYEGAQTTLYLCLNPELKGNKNGGKYFVDCKEDVTEKYCNDKKIIDEVWDWSENECKNFENKN
jgi:hypothetical protein